VIKKFLANTSDGGDSNERGNHGNSSKRPYCNSGGRSYNAYRKLMKLGYKNINQSIFADWKEQGLPIESKGL
jgi:hypothetical protein